MDKVTPDYINADDRGKLVQLVHEGYKQINVITCRKGSVRGGHYHKLNKELFYVLSGSFDLELSKDGIIEKYQIGPEMMFIIEPYTSHLFFYTEDTILISAYSEGVELPDGKMDIFKTDD